MIKVIHQNLTVDQNSIAVMVILMDLKEFHPVPIVQEDCLSFVSSADDMVIKRQDILSGLVFPRIGVYQEVKNLSLFRA